MPFGESFLRGIWGPSGYEIQAWALSMNKNTSGSALASATQKNVKMWGKDFPEHQQVTQCCLMSVDNKGGICYDHGKCLTCAELVKQEFVCW